METDRAPWTEFAAATLVRFGVLLLLALLQTILPGDGIVFNACMAVAFVAAVPASLWMRRRWGRVARHAPLQYVADLVLVAALVYFTGGAASRLALLYPLALLSFGIVATPRQTAEFGILAIVLYTLTITLRGQELAIEYLSGNGTADPRRSLVAMLSARMAVFALFGLAGALVARYCRIAESRPPGAVRPTDRLLDAIESAVLFLDRDGGIVKANEAASTLLGRPRELLLESRLVDLQQPGSESKFPAEHLPGAFFTVPGRDAVPLSIRKTDLALPAAELLEAEETGANLSVSVVVLGDLSLALALRQAQERLEHMNDAIRIAGEMAHDIRTPLTAFSASVELLSHLERHATAADWLPNSPRKKERTELFEHILGAMEQMDAAVRSFCDFAEFSPVDLLSIIRLDSANENRGYMGQFNSKVRGFSNGQDPDCGRRSDHTQLAE